MKTAERKPLASCANGCGVPPSPPSLVICRACQDRITEMLTKLANGERIDESKIARKR